MRIIEERRFLQLISLIPFLLCDGICHFLGLSLSTVTIFWILDCFFILFLFIRYKQTISSIGWILALIYSTILISSIFNNTFSIAVKSYIPGLAMCMVFEFWLRFDFDDFMSTLSKILVLYVLLNFLCVLLFPEGMYQDSLYTLNWLLGYKNTHFGYIILSITLLVINSYKSNRKLNIWIALFCGLGCVSLFLVDSVMASAILCLYCIMLFLVYIQGASKYVAQVIRYINLKNILILGLLINLLILFFQTNSTISGFFAQVLGVFGRDASFSGRVPIWNATIDLICASPIFGYGIIESNEYVRISGILGGTHAHNYLLNLLVMGGLVCLIEHTYLYVFVTKKLQNNDSFNIRVLHIVIGLYFLSGITNVNFYSVLFNPIFILAYYVFYEEKRRIRIDKVNTKARVKA